jgi:uncharacterized protein (TIGR02285 family)
MMQLELVLINSGRWMRQLQVLNIVLILNLFLCWAVQAEEKETILWLRPDFPPVYFIDGPNVGTGLGDRTSTYIFHRLSEYRHVQRVSNFKRIIKTLSVGKKACSMTLLKNREREKVIAYSEQMLASPQNAIITLQRNRQAFAPFSGNSEAVSLKSLLLDSNLVLGYSNGRSYSNKVDQIIRAHTNQKNSAVTSGSNIFEGVMKMMQYGRIDYTIGYAYEGQYMAQRLGFEEKVISIPLQEHPDVVPVYIGCPKTDWGRHIIARLNPIIISSRSKPAFYGVYKKWMDPIAWKNYELFIQKHFNERTP